MIPLLRLVDFSGKPLGLFVFSEQCRVSGPVLPNSWLLSADSRGTCLWTGKISFTPRVPYKLQSMFCFATCFATFLFPFFFFCQKFAIKFVFRDSICSSLSAPFGLTSFHLLLSSFDPVALKIKHCNMTGFGSRLSTSKCFVNVKCPCSSALLSANSWISLGVMINMLEQTKWRGL